MNGGSRTVVEDALKVTRNLQRLLLVACVVAMVFLASLRDVSRERALLDALSQLPQQPLLLDHQQYERWVRESFAERAIMSLTFFSEQVDHMLAVVAKQGLGRDRGDLDPLREALISPVPVAGASLAEIGSRELKLRDLDELIGRTRCPLVFISISDRSLAHLGESLLRAFPTRRALIRDVELDLVKPPPPIDQLRHSGALVPLELTFEVLSPESQSRYTITVDGRCEPDFHHSVVDWWAAEFSLHLLHPLMRWKDIEPPLKPDARIDAIQVELERRIATAQAANRTIDLLGLSIPGSLALFAIPATLLGFIGSLLIHLAHLHRIAAQHRQTFRQFSWTPVSPGEMWLWESTGLLLVLPVCVHLLLIYRAPAFGDELLLPVLAGFVGAVGCARAGVALLRSISRLRRKLFLV